MTSEQIATLAASGGSDKLEFKGTTGTRLEATKTVCAFLNQYQCNAGRGARWKSL